ncbi:hypothetical protein HMPREF1871_00861 [Gemelliphila asaccharolytica]|uniref:Uncharacterized protein n=1 Tax=Gemelliphila asaccharolytica TaxID=502393 RepID=A0ABR5TLC2_9BACL|nr:hypothetical protein HMPREF1871_00861 [Gemella asaccharolytica]
MVNFCNFKRYSAIKKNFFFAIIFLFLINFKILRKKIKYFINLVSF